MTETNRIEYKRDLTSELDIEKEVVALFHEPTFARCVYMYTSIHSFTSGFP